MPRLYTAAHSVSRLCNAYIVWLFCALQSATGVKLAQAHHCRCRAMWLADGVPHENLKQSDENSSLWKVYRATPCVMAASAGSLYQSS